MLKNGVILVNFENMNGRDNVIEVGVFYFDKKINGCKLQFFDF